jgi:hypothetical protein
MTEELINKVALSPLVTLDLETFYPKEPVVLFDIKSYLYQGLIIREKEFRESLKQLDWQAYQNKWVTVTCTVDAVIPVWAYMLIATYLQPVAKAVFLGDEETATRQMVIEQMEALDTSSYKDKRVVIKGCGEQPIADFAYLEITKRLLPVVKSIMYGEPCSTVPVYKSK